VLGLGLGLPATESVGIATVCFLDVLCNIGQDFATRNVCSGWSCSTEAFSGLLSAIREKPLSAYLLHCTARPVLPCDASARPDTTWEMFPHIHR
jgi:hypothetical protein